jgi:hypothetical protein
VVVFQQQPIGRDGTDIEGPFKEVLSLPSTGSILKGKECEMKIEVKSVLSSVQCSAILW